VIHDLWALLLKVVSSVSFIHLVVCLTTGPKPLPKRALHIVRSRAFSFKWEYTLLSLKLSNSFLRLLPCLPVTSIPPCIFPSITRCRMQFLRRLWPIQFRLRSAGSKRSYQFVTFSEWLEIYEFFLLIVVNALLWTATRHPHYASLNQLDQGQTAETAPRNLHYSQPRAAWVAAGRGVSENLLKAQVHINWSQFHEVKLNLYFNFIRDYPGYSALPAITNRETWCTALFSDITRRDFIICGNVSLCNMRHVTYEKLQHLGTTHTRAR
jgi:hypothetical protein